MSRGRCEDVLGASLGPFWPEGEIQGDPSQLLGFLLGLEACAHPCQGIQPPARAGCPCSSETLPGVSQTPFA